MSEAVRRILIVDDEAEMRVLCAKALSEVKRGYVVEAAEDARQARDLIAQRDFDLLILDIHLPEEDGITLLRQIRTTHPGLPAVLITGYPAVNTAMGAVRLEASDYLCKPFSFGKLLQAVEASLS